MANENIKIEDNFLDQEEFDKLQSHMGQPNVMHQTAFPWYFNDSIDAKSGSPTEVDKFQFVHSFYESSTPISQKFILVAPILDIIQPLAIYRIKANLLTKTPNIVENTFHVDIGDIPETNLKYWTNSILYINTNNGYTEFENGTKVESVANRMVTFPTNLRHRGTSCTDEKTRVAINFVYFKSRDYVYEKRKH